jgi:hypothetical protein
LSGDVDHEPSSPESMANMLDEEDDMDEKEDLNDSDI